MKKEILLIIGIMLAINLSLKAQTLYNHSGLHLTFTIDNEKKEAMVGSGLDYTMANAICYPPYDDDYWSNFNNLWEDIIIPSYIDYGGEPYKVTSIAPYAFYKCTYIKKILLPETIHTIGCYAFYWCINLESVNIPSEVTNIEENTFNNCRSITSINIPKKITSIGNMAFIDCKSLSNLTIPASCTIIGTDAFSWCINIKSLTFEGGNKPLEISYAYSTSISYQGSDPNKFRGLFADCSIDTLYLDRNLSCPVLGDKVYPPFKGISNYCSYAGYYQGFIGNNFDNIQFGDCVTEIPDELFCESRINNQFELPKNLKIIGKNAFKNFLGKSIIPIQIEITFPETLESIGSGAFEGTEQWKIIRCNAVNPPSLLESFGSNNNVIVIVPNGTGPIYRKHEIWSKYTIVDSEDKLITINIKKAGSLYSRLLAQDIQTLDVRRIKLTGMLNSDDWATLASLENLNECDLSEIGNTEIPNNVFQGNNKIIEIKLPNLFTSLKDSTFYNCTHLIRVC